MDAWPYLKNVASVGGSSQTVHNRGIITQQTSRQKGHFLKNLDLHFQGNDFILQRETLAREKLTKTLFLTLSIDFYFLRHVCLSTHVAGYGFHRCTSGRDGAVERSHCGVVHFGTWRDNLRQLHYVPEVSLSWPISVQFYSSWELNVEFPFLFAPLCHWSRKLFSTNQTQILYCFLRVVCSFSTFWLVQSCDYMYVLWNWIYNIWLVLSF